MSDGLKTFLGYCLAVTAATLPYIMLLILPDIPNFESATSYSIETKIRHFLEGAMFMEIAAWLFVFVLAAIPFFVALRFADEDKNHSCKFHVIGATITAMLIGPLSTFMQLGINVGEDAPSPEYQYLSHMLFFAPFGVLAGFTFWRFAKFSTPSGDAHKRRAAGMAGDASPSLGADSFGKPYISWRSIIGETDRSLSMMREAHRLRRRPFRPSLTRADRSPCSPP